MKLVNIQVTNFRSIKNIVFEINKIGDGNTYTLIGINETGKSSFLKAISLIDEGEILYPLDFLDEKQPVNVYLTYNLESSELDNFKSELLEKGLDKQIVDEIEIETVKVSVNFEPLANTKRHVIDRIEFKKIKFPDFTLQESKAIAKDPNTEQDDFDLEKYLEINMPDHFWKLSHHITFWKSDNKFLINEPINLDQFKDNPKEISVPLTNCFGLAGIETVEDIKSAIEKVRIDPAETNNLQEKLGDKVTEHIKRVWPNHPVKIKFQINNMMLSFLIEDVGVQYKAKITSQRSDGFKQFVSFLLTISAENIMQQLNYSLLLLDEPETHLHPQAQEYLREELIKLSKKENENIVIFATHSNYMIDKDNLDRCFRVFKNNEAESQIEQIKGNATSYSEVNYNVFNVPTTDYHNELYGFLEDVEPNKLKKLPTSMKWYNDSSKKTDDVSLAKYIRNSIHHPENTKNKKYTTSQLLESLKNLRKLKYGTD